MKVFDSIKAKLTFFFASVFAFADMWTETRGESSINRIIGISLGLVVASVMIPLGVNQVLQAENTSWGVVGTIFTVLLPIIAVLAIVLMFLKR